MLWGTEAWVETELGLEMGSVSSAVGTPKACDSASIFGSPAVKRGCSASAASASENSRDCIGASLTVGIEKFDVSGFDHGRRVSRPGDATNSRFGEWRVQVGRAARLGRERAEQVNVRGGLAIVRGPA